MKLFTTSSTLPVTADSQHEAQHSDPETPNWISGGRHMSLGGQCWRLAFASLLAIVIPVLLTEFFEDWADISEAAEWLLHSIVLVATVIPTFYFLWYRPLIGEMNEHARAESEVSRLSRRVMDASEEERRRLARDLHDDTGQKLVALQLQLDLHRKKLAGSHPELAEECLQISHAISNLADDLRHVIVALRPPLLDDFGLVPALEAHLADLRRFCPNLAVQVVASGMGGRLPMEVETALFRVCQEALNNVIRHARAKHVELRLTGSYPTVILIIEDDGVGFQVRDPVAAGPEGQHCGLSGIRERIAAVGGRVKVQSAPGKGTRLRIEVPLSIGS